MTSWLITHDTRWKAAVSGAAVNDWIQYGAMTDAKSFTPEFIGAKPWNNSSLLSVYKAESPLTYADRVKTPTLILSDAGDFRVPTPLAYEFYRYAVRATGTTGKIRDLAGQRPLSARSRSRRGRLSPVGRVARQIPEVTRPVRIAHDETGRR